MFLEFFHLREQPFGVTPDPAYLYPSRTHLRALSALSHGVSEGRGFLGLVAEPGLGKTTLLNHLMDQVRETTCTVFLFQTHCNAHEFFEYVLSELGVDTRGLGLVAMHNKLNEALFAQMFAGQRFLLVVDEAQNLSEPVLETLRMLSNYETQHSKLLQIVLAGQPQLAVKLAHPRLTQLRQRIAVLSQLDPLTPQETEGYVQHRLETAGYSGPPLFTPEALALVARESRGVPRVINHICYHALSAARDEGLRTIGGKLVREAVARLDLKPRPAATPPVVACPVVRAPSVEVSPLTYNPPAHFPLARRALRAMTQARQGSRAAALTASLLVAGLLWFPTLLRPDSPGQVTAANIISPASSRPLAAPKPAAESARAAHPAELLETGSRQVLTVVAGPQQTLKEISLRYVGEFDYNLFEEICTLNPELPDPYHLESGQLIRLPIRRETSGK